MSRFENSIYRECGDVENHPGKEPILMDMILCDIFNLNTQKFENVMNKYRSSTPITLEDIKNNIA